MKKNATMADKIEIMAKTLIKEFKSNKDAKSIDISSHFSEQYNEKTRNYDKVFTCGKVSVELGNLSDEMYGSITCKVGNAICEKIRSKMKKNEVIYRDVEECRGCGCGYFSSKYSIFNRIVIVRFCKDFIVINKKLVKLGCKEINFKDWYIDYVSGKRSSIFDHDVHYYAESEKMCAKVLEFLKGKKKLSYEFFDDNNLENREYGERYETEWDGSMSRKIRFIDSKGHKTPIYGF